MMRPFLRCKIHRATVTDANLNYVGSITIDASILQAIDLLPYEKVQVVNNNNGARLETYVIPGKQGSGVICLNGAAARLAQKGDILIIMAYALMNETECKNVTPAVAVLDQNNRIEKLLSGEQPMQIL
ncbi:aspartate 1-decarboxylase [Sporolactobacillus laevolacticus]|uniref:Aspartate 1-decarboxylase n=1 Tax=Sporolactobacillus laevolacticus DSM 442 TaxID=1395513 RepID=V6IVK4_9BACL|nr:aspartate 1-decarboxylase [Sporolactobacillus laevolacticus]EST10541.1 aspartate decarboxylase [Sporolactobacillus laevolacticus DSM 442]